MKLVRMGAITLLAALWTAAYAEEPKLTSKGTVKGEKIIVRFYRGGTLVATQTRDKKGNPIKTIGTIPDGKILGYDEKGTLVAETTYRGGMKNGLRKEYDEKGTLILETTYRGDMINGLQKTYEKDGGHRLFNYVDNKRNGPFKKFDEKGNLLTVATMKDDQLDGPATVLYPTGHIQTLVSYVEGKSEGLETMYSENGKLKSQITYQDDHQNGPATFYNENGKIRSVAEVKNDKFDGLTTNYGENGKVTSTINYKNGARDGMMTTYNENGNVLEKINYYKGEPDGKDQIFSPDGQVASEKNHTSSTKDAAEFEAVLKKYRNHKKPKLDELNLQMAVQAEGLVEGKHWDVAIDFYRQILAKAPWWSTGHYDLAEILGENGHNEEAIREMKKYLALEPHAKDARDAQDDIYRWGGKAGQ